MIILDSTTKSLQVKLTATPTTALQIVGGYVDIETTNFGVSAIGSISTTATNTTAVTAASAPGSGRRHIKQLAVYNADSASSTVTVQLNDNSTLRIIVKVVLAAGDTLNFAEDGWKVINSNGQVKGGPSLVDDSVTNAILNNMDADRIKGRANGAGTGDPTDLTAAQVYAIVKTQLPYELCLAISDETTTITTGAPKVTFRMPKAMTLTSVKASLTTASSSGIPTVDINEGGTTILSTKLTIDATELTSTTAATAAVISDSALAADAEITIDIDVAGTGAKGLKVYLIGTIA